MGSLSPAHWLLVLIVVLLLFGPKNLANIGKGLGQGLRSFKKELGDDPVDDSSKVSKELGDRVNAGIKTPATAPRSEAPRA